MNFNKLISSIFYPVYWAAPDKAKELWSFYEESLGKNSKKTISDKLDQMDLSTIYYFLFFLKRVELDKALYFANNRLDIDLLVGKAQNVEFTSIEKIVTLLYGLAPEESKYSQVLREKALNILRKLDPSALGKQVHREQPSLRTVRDVLIIMSNAEDGDAMVANFLSQIDPHNFGNNAQSQILNLQAIYFFLRYVRKNQTWAYKFLQGFGKESLLDIFRSANSPDSIKNCLRIIKKINSDLASDLKKQIFPTSETKRKVLLRSGINEINTTLWDYLGNRIKIPEEWIQQTVAELSEQDLDEKIRNLYQNPDIENPLKILGQFLKASNRISYHTRPDTAKEITQQVVKTFNNLELPSNYTLEELSLLALNVHDSNGNTFRDLMSGILSKANLESFIKIPVFKGVGRLLWLVYQYNLQLRYRTTNYQQLSDKVLQHDLTEIFQASGIEAISELLWYMARIDITKTREWVEKVEPSVWVEVITKKIKEAGTEPEKIDTILASLFRLLCQLYQVDKNSGKENLGCKVAYDSYRFILELISAKPKLRPDGLPILGLLSFLLSFYKLKVDLKDLSLPPPYLIADKLIAFYLRKPPGVMQFAFSVLCLNRLAPDLLVREFLHEFTMRYPEYLQESVDQYPFPHIQNTLREIIFSQSLNRTQDEKQYFTFTKMILLTQTRFDERGFRGDPYIAFGELGDFLIKNPVGNTLFKSPQESKGQLTIALTQNIYRSEVKPHFRNQDITVTRLYLNRSNSIVTSTLNIAKSLVTVLNKATTQTKPVSSKDWEEALSKDPSASSINSAELEYFKRLLLWIGAIKEEYQDNAPFFSLKYEHPLVKSHVNGNSY